MTQDARCDTEIKKKMALSKDTCTKMNSVFTNRNIRIYTKIKTLKAYNHMVHPSVWRWMLDTDKRLRKKTWSSRNVMHQNFEYIMDWKEVKRRRNGKGRIQKIPTQNYQKKTTTIYWGYKQSWWIRKTNIERKDVWYQKQRKTTHKIHRQSE